MRLLNIYTLEFGEFLGKDVPQYWILSHRWGDGEVSYKDFRKGHKRDAPGYRKIVRFCDFAKKIIADMNLEKVMWAWIDTCCIDKRSSAELSEAINSMYAWYQKAYVAIVFLTDVVVKGGVPVGFKDSSWFRRGWTLQELLAPEMLIFCDADWRIFGHVEHRNEGVDEDEDIDDDEDLGRVEDVEDDEDDEGESESEDEAVPRDERLGPNIACEVSEITGIPVPALVGFCPNYKYSVAQRMSWASRRETTRKEDEAYCLLGIFDINMPLLYGEGHKAFKRLQIEIIRSSTDQSLFAWRQNLPWPGYDLLAESPKAFEDSGDVESLEKLTRHPYSVTNHGLEVYTGLTTFRPKNIFAGPDIHHWTLHCMRRSKKGCDGATSGERTEVAISLLRFENTGQYLCCSGIARPEDLEIVTDVADASTCKEDDIIYIRL